MPEATNTKAVDVTKAADVTEKKTQPWKAVWPAPEADPATESYMAKAGSGLNGAHGYNDKGEGVAPQK